MTTDTFTTGQGTVSHTILKRDNRDPAPDKGPPRQILLTGEHAHERVLSALSAEFPKIKKLRVAAMQARARNLRERISKLKNTKRSP